MTSNFSDERIDDLQYKGLMLIQRKDCFCFGVDAVLLADFADVRKGDRVLDMGTGTGIIAILISVKKSPASVVGLEIQSRISEMAARSVELNNLQGKVSIINGDLKNSVQIFGPSSFDVVVSNPPYMQKGGGLLNLSDTKAVSRHELLCNLEDVIGAGSKLLHPGGRFAMVHRPERLADILCLMRNYGLEPKHLRMIHPSPYKKPNLLLVDGVKGGRPQLKVMDPLYVYDDKGKYSDEINRIYCRGEYLANGRSSIK